MIRAAILTDFEEVKHLKDALTLDVHKLSSPEYRLKLQTNGFLLGNTYTPQDHEKDIQNIFLVYTESESTIGYIRIDETHEMKDDLGTYWYKPDLKDVYFSSPHLCIGGIGILPEWEGKGIGTKLLNYAIELVKQKGASHLFSFVALSPVTNIPSIIFHEKNGFERAMYSEPELLFGMQDYQCFLYARKL